MSCIQKWLGKMLNTELAVEIDSVQISKNKTNYSNQLLNEYLLHKINIKNLYFPQS